MARNQHENAVAAFRRDINGLLTPVGRFPTGGAGNPFPQPGDPPVDPLASQGALIMSDGKRFLIAVNAGSNQIPCCELTRIHLNWLISLIQAAVVQSARRFTMICFTCLMRAELQTLPASRSTKCDGTLKSLPNSTRPLVGAANADPRPNCLYTRWWFFGGDRERR
jgi:hypothetical protein